MVEETVEDPETGKKRKAIEIVSWMMAVSGVILLLTLAAHTLILLPRLIETFSDFDVQLPSLTILFLKQPRSVMSGLYLLIAVGLIGKEFISAINAWARLAINALVLMMISGLAIAYALAIAMPWLELNQSLN